MAPGVLCYGHYARWSVHEAARDWMVYHIVTKEPGIDELPPPIEKRVSQTEVRGQMRPLKPGEQVPEIIPLREVRKAAILEAMRITGNNVTKAMKLLKISKATMYRNLNKYGLRRVSVFEKDDEPDDD